MGVKKKIKENKYKNEEDKDWEWVGDKLSLHVDVKK